MQHCPNCGAENDADAQFCAECGTPLDVQVSSDMADNDQTILSTNISAEIVEGQKTEIFKHDSDNDGDDDDETVVISQEDIVEAITDDEPEIVSPSPETASASSGGGGIMDQPWMTQRNMIIGGVILLALLCCCCSATLIGLVALGPVQI